MKGQADRGSSSKEKYMERKQGSYRWLIAGSGETGAADSNGQLSWRWWSSLVLITQIKAGCLLPKPPELNLSYQMS